MPSLTHAVISFMNSTKKRGPLSKYGTLGDPRCDRFQRRHFSVDNNALKPVLDRGGALFGDCSSCGFSNSFGGLGRFYEFARSPLCAGTGDDPKGHAGD